MSEETSNANYILPDEHNTNINKNFLEFRQEQLSLAPMRCKKVNSEGEIVIKLKTKKIS